MKMLADPSRARDVECAFLVARVGDREVESGARIHEATIGAGAIGIGQDQLLIRYAGQGVGRTPIDS